MDAGLLMATGMAVAWNTLFATCHYLLVMNSAFELRNYIRNFKSPGMRYCDILQRI
jgi:hypothetical protein